MISILSLPYKYRWELIPLFSMIAARSLSVLIARILDSRGTEARIETHGIPLLTALALLLLLPRVRRQGRPMLVALWLILLLPTAADAAFRLPLELAMELDLVGNARQLAYLFLPGALATWALVGWLGARYAVYGMRFAMLVPATYLAVGSIGTLAYGVSALTVFNLGGLYFVILQTIAFVFGVVVAVPVAYVFHHGMSMAAERLKRWVIMLMAFSIVAPVASQLSFAVRSTLEGDSVVNTFGMILIPILFNAVYIILVLGAAWLFSLGRMRTAQA